ncbi:MAG: VWA domain-containing protein [Candidatus Saccharimonas sp.]
MRKKFWVVIGAIMALMLTACGGSGEVQTLTYDQAAEQVRAYVSEGKVQYHDELSGPDDSWIGTNTTSIDLPPIEKYPLSVQGNGEMNIEVFSSTEKSGIGSRRWLDTVAQDFNNSGATIDGKSVTISTRPIPSGLAMDYIRTKSYIPDAYTPSNEMWGQMIDATGVNIQMIEPRLAGNVAGILLKQDLYDSFVAKYGEVTAENIVKASLAGDLKLGHTDPNLSSTGLNLVMQELSAIDPSNPVSATAAEQFRLFQNTVPVVSPTTEQLAAVAAKGRADAVINEAQAYPNEPTLASGWVFTPVGVRHDNPLYALNNLSADKVAALKLFADYAKSSPNQELAGTFGFNQYNDYAGVSGDKANGSLLLRALDLWKQEKDGGKPVITVIVVDKSGSMNNNDRLDKIKSALNAGANYISPSSYVGLLSYSDAGNITVNLPIAPFDGNQHSLFVGAVNNLSASGNTATYSAMYAALDLMLKQKASIPDAELRLVVMTDGDRNTGLDLNDALSVTRGLDIATYAVGYDADVKIMEQLAGTEGYLVNAGTEDVAFRIKNMFRAEL